MTTAAEAPQAPVLPPLLRAEAARQGEDPLHVATRAADASADPGLVAWSPDDDRMRAALLLAPEMPLERAMTAVLAAAVGFADALGALAPPEVAVHVDWPGGLRVNGAGVGHIRAAAATADPGAEPDWLVVAVEVGLLPSGDGEPGHDPDTTTLVEEGCGALGRTLMLEAWGRHTLAWIHRLTEDGPAPVIAAWLAKYDRVGATVTRPGKGRVLGLDDAGGLLLAAKAGTALYPLTLMLEPAP